MVGDGILDGDVVIVEPRDQARDGEIVVAVIDGVEATLKRLRIIEGPPAAIELRPANPRMEVLRYAPDRVRVTGVVTGQMRSYLARKNL
jgi:repressor LexA